MRYGTWYIKQCLDIWLKQALIFELLEVKDPIWCRTSKKWWEWIPFARNWCLMHKNTANKVLCSRNSMYIVNFRLSVASTHRPQCRILLWGRKTFDSVRIRHRLISWAPHNFFLQPWRALFQRLNLKQIPSSTHSAGRMQLIFSIKRQNETQKTKVRLFGPYKPCPVFMIMMLIFLSSQTRGCSTSWAPRDW